MCCHNEKFVITGGTGGCLKDNLQCHRWRQIGHYDNSRFWVYLTSFSVTKLNRVHIDEIYEHQPTSSELFWLEQYDVIAF